MMNETIYRNLRSRYDEHLSSYALWGDDPEDLTIFDQLEVHQKLNTDYIAVGMCMTCPAVDHDTKTKLRLFHGTGQPAQRFKSAFEDSPMEGTYITHFFKQHLFSSDVRNAFSPDASSEDMIDFLRKWMKKEEHRSELLAHFAVFAGECRDLQNPNLVVLTLKKDVYDFIMLCKEAFKDIIPFPYRVIQIPSPHDIYRYPSKEGYVKAVNYAIIKGLY